MRYWKNILNKIIVFRENNPRLFVVFVIILINICSVMVSSALLMFLPENDGRSYFEMLRFAFTLMVNPSGRYTYSDYPVSLIVTTVVVLIGMISLTGGAVGYITNLINGIVEKTARSKNKINLHDHIVILNYNHKVPSMICEFSFDDEETCVVVLTKSDTEEVKNRIISAIEKNANDRKFKNIIVRNGDPKSKLDLDNISLCNARSVFIMSPDDDVPVFNGINFDSAKLFLFITWYFEENKINNFTEKINILVETEHECIDEILKRSHRAGNSIKVTPINYNDILGKLMAMIAISPCFNDVLLHLLSFEGVELYIRDVPDYSIGEDILRQNTALPLYDTIVDGKLKRIYISENHQQLEMVKDKPAEFNRTIPDKKIDPDISPEKYYIIIVGTNSKLPYILESLNCYRKECCNNILYVTLADVEEKMNDLLSYYSDDKYKELLNSDNDSPVIINDIHNPMAELQLGEVNSILFLSDETEDYSNIDEKPLFFWSNLNLINADFSHRDCIIEILDTNNKNIIEKTAKDQVVVSDKFISCLYALLSKDSGRFDVIKDMITFEGDSVSVDSDGQSVNKCNLISVKASKFFKGIDSTELKFKSKREFIYWTYMISDKKYIPIGLYKNGIDYLFSRIDNDSNVRENLDHCILLQRQENAEPYENTEEIIIEPDDEIVIFMNVE